MIGIKGESKEKQKIKNESQVEMGVWENNDPIQRQKIQGKEKE